MRRALLTLALALSTAARAEILTYVETGNAPASIALGYPVPLPLDTQAATDGFRRHDALLAGLQDLALRSDALHAQRLGASLAGRDVLGFVAGDADTSTPDGRIEGAVLIDGGIHAREWASPEVVAGLIEDLLAPEALPGLRRYLLEVQTTVLVPVLNVDGFLQTQRYPAQVLRSEFPGEARTTPRDGRMQRKNLRDKDEILCASDDPACTVADGMRGVDLNRNHAPYWASSNGSSSDPRSLVFHGSGPGSEPESLALYAAAALAPAARLRLYVDAHSFGRELLGVHTGNVRRDANQDRLAARLRAATGNRYRYATGAAGAGIGATDEYFATTQQVPSYTLEIEPGPNGATEYGGFGNDHDGFILPASQIARVRAELAATLMLGMYCMAGPPALRAVEVRESGSGRVVFAGRWIALDSALRRFEVSTREPLRGGLDYRLRVAFDKPMRVRDIGGAVVQYLGQDVALAPAVSLEVRDRDNRLHTQALAADAGAWLGASGFERYADDSFDLGFSPAASLPLDAALRVNLAIRTPDLCGQALDTNPATAVDWSNGAWTGLENDAGVAADSGGTDRTLRLVDDGAPTVPPHSSGSGGGGTMGWSALALLGLAAWRRRYTVR